MIKLIKDKRAGFTDLFLFMILAIVIVFISGIFIYIGLTVNTELHSKLDSKMFGTLNGSDLVTNTMGKVSQAYDSLYWISIMLIIGMILSIFIGNYLVTTRPIFFIPYIFILIIAIIVSAGLSNAYGEVITNPTLSSVFDKFVGANFILAYLPLWISVIGIVGGIIMFARMGSKEGEVYGGYR